MSTGTSRNLATAAARRDGADDALRMARARRMAWALAAIVIACYIGFMVLTGIKGAP